MVKDPKLEQANINKEFKETTEPAVEKSLDSAKQENLLETEQTQTAEKQENIQTSPQVPLDTSTENLDSGESSFEAVHKNVENVLTENMDNIFLSLDAGLQKTFKLKGEEVAQKITGLLMQAKVKAQEISKLILEWLRIIPQVNKHYIEQEAKIKTEKILKIKENK